MFSPFAPFLSLVTDRTPEVHYGRGLGLAGGVQSVSFNATTAGAASALPAGMWNYYPEIHRNDGDGDFFYGPSLVAISPRGDVQGMDVLGLGGWASPHA